MRIDGLLKFTLAEDFPEESIRVLEYLLSDKDDIFVLDFLSFVLAAMLLIRKLIESG